MVGKSVGRFYSTSLVGTSHPPRMHPVRKGHTYGGKEGLGTKPRNILRGKRSDYVRLLGQSSYRLAFQIGNISLRYSLTFSLCHRFSIGIRRVGRRATCRMRTYIDASIIPSDFSGSMPP